MALTHDSVWSAIDILADRQGLTTAALAKKAGLDPTSLNPSKRSSNGRARWPSTETIAKLLNVSSATLDDLMTMRGCERETLWGWLDRVAKTIPVLSASPDEAHAGEGRLVPEPIDNLQIPEHLVGDPEAFVFRISGSALSPIYRSGTLIIVSQTLSSGPDDCVLIKNLNNTVLIGRLDAQSDEEICLMKLDKQNGKMWVDRSELDTIQRIVWASQ